MTLGSWFEIDEKEYMWYILQGYEISANSTVVNWYLNGERHRTDGPAREHRDGTHSWYLNGKFHRTDGPACEWTDGSHFWYLNGKYHRTDGPAREWADGYRSWYLNGVKYTEEEFYEQTNQLV